MRVWLNKNLLNKYKEMEDYRITYIVAPWGSGKTTTLKYYMKAYSKNRRIYIDSRVESSFQRMQKTIIKEMNNKQKKYMIIDHIQGNVEQYIEEFERFTAYNDLRLILVSDNIVKPFILKRGEEKIFYITYDCFNYNMQDIMKLAKYNGVQINTNECGALFHMSDGWAYALYTLLEQHKKGEGLQNRFALFAIHEILLFYNLQKYMDVIANLSFMQSFELTFLNELIENEDIMKYITQMTLSHFLFVEIKPGQFCMHEILRSYILNYYPLSQKQHNQIHLKLATWFLKHQWIVFAIYHYHKSEQYAKVLKFIKTYAYHNYIDEYPEMICEVYTSIPCNIIVEEPFAYLKIISDMLTTIDPIEGYKMFETFKTLLNSGEIVGNYDELKAETYIIEGFLHFGDLDMMTYFFKKAHTFFHKKKSKIVGNQLVTTLGCPHILSIYYRKGYSLSYIYKDLHKNFDIYLDIAHNNGMGMDILVEAEYHMECGNVEIAKELALRSKYISDILHQDAIKIASIFLLARISIYEHDKENSSSYILELENYTSCQMLMYEAHCALGYLYVISEQYHKIMHWRNETCELPYDPTQYNTFSNGLAYLYTLEYEKANACAQLLLRQYQQNGMLFHKIYGNILLCAIQKDISLKMTYFEELLKQCEQDGMLMIFLEFYKYLYPCIIELSKKEHLSIFEKNVIEHAMLYQKEKNLLHTLSEKERVVSNYLLTGFPAKTIAELLDISINTVNYHIKNIYRKLSVKSKLEMISIYGSFNK